ncbi:MAG: hypothetical protein RLN81_07335 [Balneolaceae bacterium]
MNLNTSKDQSAPHQNSGSRILMCFLLLGFLLVPILSTAQELQASKDLPSPRGAFLRSMVLPGWGHQYIDKTDWKRGQYHMAADAVMILSYLGLRSRVNYLEGNLETFALSKANADLSGRNREFFLAIANFDNLDEYNDFQLRTRNWNNLLSDTPENQWNWTVDGDRLEYQDMRERIDKNKNQLPALVTLMVANRVISGLNAFVRARKIWSNPPDASLSYVNELGQPGITANLRFSF